MDLGFGKANQVVGNAAAKLMLQTAQVQEQAIESEMAAYDALLDDDDAMEAMRARRLEQLKVQQQQRQEWKALGHGTYSELAGSDVARAFFDASKASPRLVVHFYQPKSRDVCDVVHRHLDDLAPRHLETRFCKINVEGCDHGAGGAASYLVEKLGIHVMPTLVLVKDRKVVHHIRGFDELGGNAEFSMRALEYVLGVHGAIHKREGDEDDVPSELLLENMESVNKIRIRGSNRTGGADNKSSIRDGLSGNRFDEDE